MSEVAFTVTDTSRLVAYLNIPQTELSKFSPGHEAALSVDSMPDTEFQGVVARISPTIDTRSGTFRATVYIDNENGDLAPGMFGRFTISYEKHANALVVPAAAVVREDNESVVYVVTDGAAVRRLIETGIQSESRVEILDGLEKNEEKELTQPVGECLNGSTFFLERRDQRALVERPVGVLRQLPAHRQCSLH